MLVGGSIANCPWTERALVLGQWIALVLGQTDRSCGSTEEHDPAEVLGYDRPQIRLQIGDSVLQLI